MLFLLFLGLLFGPPIGGSDLVAEIMGLHQVHFSPTGNLIYYEPIGEPVFHANADKTIGYRLNPNASSVDWCVTVTEVIHKKKRIRCLYTNFVLEGIVLCKKTGDPNGCVRKDPPTEAHYLNSLLAGAITGLSLRASLKIDDLASCAIRLLAGGLGSGVIPVFIERAFPTYVCMDVVELLPALIEAATDDLGVHLPSGRVRIIQADIKEYLLATPDEKYDAIIMDISGAGFGENTRNLPSEELSTNRFVANLRRTLKPDGVYAQHYWNTTYSTTKFQIATQIMMAEFPNNLFLRSSSEGTGVGVGIKSDSKVVSREDLAARVRRFQRELNVSESLLNIGDLVERELTKAPDFSSEKVE